MATREEEIEALMRELGKLLKSSVLPGYGFSLIIAGPMDTPDPRLFYVSNINRLPMIGALEKLVKEMKGGLS